MDNQDKIKMLEDMFDLDAGSLAPETVLEELDVWDSMNKLSLIILIDEEFGRVITGEDVLALKTVADILELMTAQ